MNNEGNNNLFDFDLSAMTDSISEIIDSHSEEVENIDDNDTNKENVDDAQEDLKTHQDEGENINEDTTEEDDETVEEEDDISNDGEDANSTEDTENSPSLVPYAKLLVDEGILPNLDLENFDGSAEGLVEAARNEVYNGINSYKENLPPEVRRVLDGYEAGVPVESLFNIKNQVAKYSQINKDELEQDEDLQKQIVKDYYKHTTKLDDSKIDKLIERSSDLGELSSDALSSLDELVQFQAEEESRMIEEAKKQQELAIEQSKKQVEEFNKLVDDTTEIVPGVKMNKTIKDRIKKNITTPVAIDEMGNPVNKVGKYRIENPLKFELTLNYLFEATNGFTNFDVFSKTGKSKAIKEIEDAAKMLDSGGNNGNFSRKNSNPEVSSSIKSFLDNYK